MWDSVYKFYFKSKQHSCSLCFYDITHMISTLAQAAFMVRGHYFSVNAMTYMISTLAKAAFISAVVRGCIVNDV